jgi:hypothetical protein
MFETALQNTLTEEIVTTKLTLLSPIHSLLHAIDEADLLKAVSHRISELLDIRDKLRAADLANVENEY